MKLSKFGAKKSKELPTEPPTQTPVKSSPASTPKPAKPASKLKSICSLKMVLIGVLAVALVAVATVLLVVLLRGSESAENGAATKKSICNTPACVHLAHHLNNYADPRVDPCVDFYRAACGKFSQQNIVQHDRNGQAQMLILKIMDDFFKSSTATNSKSENTMKELYARCKSLEDQQTYDTEYWNFARKIEQNVDLIGSWPVLHSNWRRTFDLNQMLAIMAQLQVTDFGLFEISTWNEIFLEPEKEASTKVNDANFATLSSFTESMLGGRVTKAVVDANLRKAIAFSDKMEAIRATEQEYLTVDDLQSSLPSVDFDRLFRNIIDPQRTGTDYKKVMGKVNVAKADLYFGQGTNLETLLSRSSDEEIANFLIFKYIATAFYSASTEFRGVPPGGCAQFVINRFPIASLAYYSRKYFNRDSLTAVSAIVDSLRVSYEEMFGASRYMGEASKKRAKLKTQKMKFVPAMPEVNDWESFVDVIHDSLTIDPSDDLLTTDSNIRQFYWDNIFKFAANDQLFNPGAQHLIANAFYLEHFNKMSITLPLLQPPSFDSTFPKYAQIASTGMVLGHEMGHGFDNSGIRRDHNGERNMVLEPEELNEYAEGVVCLIDQYNNYNDPDYGKNLKGMATIGEMISDRLGIDASWRLYKRTDMSKEPEIVGYEGKDLDKVFFRLYAMNYCRGPDTMTLAQKLLLSHPTNSFRVNGVLQNFKPFADTFNCPAGSPMNPKTKCAIF